MRYTEEQITTFLELAQEVGITKAKRTLGYPDSWNTGSYWAKNRGVNVATDELKSHAAALREFYKEEEVKTVIQEGFSRVYEELTTSTSLTADDQKKLSEAASKYYNMWANIQGKATSITENREASELDAHLQDLLSSERARNALRKEGVPEES